METAHGGMAKHFGSKSDPTVWCFWVFLIWHVLLWTIVPALTQPNAPLDTMEMLYWGHAWQIGYYKHPPLPAWMAEAATWLFGNTAWPTYLLSQLCIAVCFWSAWRLAREMVTPWLALCAAVLLEACPYYNYTTPEFNHNVTLRACWALTTVCLYWAITRNKTRHWLLFGLVVAVGMYAKYQLVFLLAAAIGLSLWNERARSCWRRPGPYLAVVLSLSLFAPHVIWMWQHDFSTVRYAMDRVHDAPDWTNHMINPVHFLLAQAVTVGPMLLLAVPLTGWRGRLRKIESDERFHREFLAAVVFGPLLLILLISAVKGAAVRTMLGAPLFTFVGALLMFLFQTRIEPFRVRRVLVGSLAISASLVLVLAMSNELGPYLRGKPHRIHFPGRQLAADIQQIWSRRHRGQVPYVGGPWWMASNAAFYLPGRPQVYGDLDATESPWVNDEQFRQQGGVILWPLDQPTGINEQKLRQRFPNMRIERPIVVPYQTDASVPQLRVGVAIVEPDETPQRIARSPSGPPAY